CVIAISRSAGVAAPPIVPSRGRISPTPRPNAAEPAIALGEFLQVRRRVAFDPLAEVDRVVIALAHDGLAITVIFADSSGDAHSSSPTRRMLRTSSATVVPSRLATARSI